MRKRRGTAQRWRREDITADCTAISPDRDRLQARLARTLAAPLQHIHQVPKAELAEPACPLPRVFRAQMFSDTAHPEKVCRVPRTRRPRRTISPCTSDV